MILNYKGIILKIYFNDRFIHLKTKVYLNLYLQLFRVRKEVEGSKVEEEGKICISYTEVIPLSKSNKKGMIT